MADIISLATKTKVTGNEPDSLKEYSTWQEAYDYFNAELFAGKLPQVLITLQRKAKTYGYFSPNRFSNRQADTAIHELAMNPDGFNGRSDKDILSTLVHEMAHVWREVQPGKPSRGSYHCKKWAEEMKRIGLHPSSTAQPGGKETGQRVSHYIVADGMFELAYNRLERKGFKLNWNSKVFTKASKPSNKTKFTCMGCEQNAWGKPSLNIQCNECDMPMVCE